jgi:hypothetical protein
MLCLSLFEFMYFSYVAYSMSTLETFVHFEFTWDYKFLATPILYFFLFLYFVNFILMSQDNKM